MNHLNEQEREMKERLSELDALHSSLTVFNREIELISGRWKERVERIDSIELDNWSNVKPGGKETVRETLSDRQIRNLRDLRTIAHERYERDILRYQESMEITEAVEKRKSELAETLQDFSIYKNMAALQTAQSSGRDDAKIIEMLKNSRETSFKAQAFMEIGAGKSE